MDHLPPGVENNSAPSQRELTLGLVDKYHHHLIGQKIREILTSPDLETIGSSPGQTTARSLLGRSKFAFGQPLLLMLLQ
jgi:hypothetical protein